MVAWIARVGAAAKYSARVPTILNSKNVIQNAASQSRAAFQ